jgi:hypothetical protein
VIHLIGDWIFPDPEPLVPDRQSAGAGQGGLGGEDDPLEPRFGHADQFRAEKNMPPSHLGHEASATCPEREATRQSSYRDGRGQFENDKSRVGEDEPVQNVGHYRIVQLDPDVPRSK